MRRLVGSGLDERDLLRIAGLRGGRDGARNHGRHHLWRYAWWAGPPAVGCVGCPGVTTVRTSHGAWCRQARASLSSPACRCRPTTSSAAPRLLRSNRVGRLPAATSNEYGTGDSPSPCLQDGTECRALVLGAARGQRVRRRQLHEADPPAPVGGLSKRGARHGGRRAVVDQPGDDLGRVSVDGRRDRGGDVR